MMRRELFDRMYGAHSGIPSCCIEFFVRWWLPKFGSQEQRMYGDVMKDDGVQYVRCPSCLETGKKARLVICERDCGRECREDYIAIAEGD